MRTCLLLLLFLAACSGCHKGQAKTLAAPDCILVRDDFGPDGTVPITVEVVAEGLEVPWGIAWLPGGDALVTERPGRIRLLRNGALQPTPVATVNIANSSEGGLLGIAASPDFAKSRRFYMYVTNEVEGAMQNRVERWTLSEDHTRATFERVIFGGIPASKYHDGGRIRFGPDGMLYVGTGDAREPGNSQNLDTPSGKLLRLTPEGEVPADNPFPGKAAFLLGIRNTEGFDWKDRDTLYLTDHGPSGELLRRGHDEVNVVHKGDNLGWPTVYGCGSAEGLVTPSLTWEDAVPPGGAAIYTGTAIPEWKGSLLIGSLGAKHLHRVVFSPDNPRQVVQHEVYLRNQWGRLRETLMGPDGHLYVTTSNCDGRGDCTERKDVILRLRR
ncbi:MAG: PQQ-dependent sugar dehydrogenase [Archangium sp.]